MAYCYACGDEIPLGMLRDSDDLDDVLNEIEPDYLCEDCQAALDEALAVLDEDESPCLCSPREPFCGEKGCQGYLS